MSEAGHDELLTRFGLTRETLAGYLVNENEAPSDVDVVFTADGDFWGTFQLQLRRGAASSWILNWARRSDGPNQAELFTQRDAWRSAWIEKHGTNPWAST